MSEQVRAHALVTGVVQGVYFRATTMQTAVRLGLSGWVRNLADGRVEAAFEGPEDVVAEALEWIRLGPPRSVVESVDVAFEALTGESGFRVL